MLLYIILCIISVVSSNQISTIVEINTGLIEGQYIKNEVTGKPYFSFKGIPYAEPPVGKLRFQPPIKVKPWSSTLQTKSDGSICMQHKGGSEDCLYLNVYTPSISNDSKNQLLPVMVYIHGGAFIHGHANSNKCGPEYLISKNVVLVTLHYRLNVFGFLNALDEVAPGNAGLKDQIAALHWVQENIAKFSGDPKQVTIFGHSAGGSSVHYLVQSKLAKGLFHKAIIQSGSTLNSFAIQENPKNKVYQLGTILGFESKNISELVQYLQNIPAELLFNTSINSEIVGDVRNILVSNAFVPSVEIESPAAFVTEYSYQLLMQNKIASSVPIIIGYVSEEMLIFLKDILNKKINLDDYKNDPTLLIPMSLNIKNDSNTEKAVINEILDHYFNNISVSNIHAFIKYQSQNMFVRGIRKSVDLMRKHHDLYFYLFTKENKNKPSEYTGVSHAEELQYIFYSNGTVETSENKLTREKLTTLWTNFAKTGNPTPNEDSLLDKVIWPLVSKSSTDAVKYLQFDNKLMIHENPEQHCFEFWNKIFTKYGKNPLHIW